MPEAFFEPIDPADGRYAATEACAGPWSSSMQHGGPPSALLVRQAELEAARSRDDLAAYRVAVEFLGPVPVGPVEVKARVVRTGRSVVLVESDLAADGRSCLQARTWLVRREPAEPTPVVTGHQSEIPGPDGLASTDAWTFPYARYVEWRPLTPEGFGPDESGPAQVWVRPRVPLVAPEPMSGLQRAALVGDSGSGVSSVLSWDAWSFVNVDLDIHLLRAVNGDWLLLDSVTRTGPAGTGLATTQLRDVDGIVGAGSQTLVISRRA